MICQYRSSYRYFLFQVNVGAEIEVRESDGKVYQATVRKVEGSKCLVHYKGWASSWDEWLKIPGDEASSEKEEKEKVLTKKAPAKSEKRKHSTSSSTSGCSPNNQNEPPPKKLKPEVVSEIEVSISTPLDQSVDEGPAKSASVSESPAQEQTKSTPAAATSSKAFQAQKTSSKKAPTPDARQKTIMSFFKRFDPASPNSQQPKSKKISKQEEEDSDEVEILEKVSPQKIDDKKSEEKELNKKNAEIKVVSSSLGFFKLADEDPKQKESAKFTCQHCKMTFSNMLTWKSHEDGHIQVRSRVFVKFQHVYIYVHLNVNSCRQT